MHINSLVLGTQTLHAVGYATGAVMEGTDEVVAVYFGDGAASQGDVNEALNWAAAAQLPVLFFCQNNQWAISTPASLQMRTPLHRRASGFGLRSYQVDGNDALAVHAVTTEAAEHIRAGGGPVFIEAQTYRRGGHSTSDDPGRYRDNDELALWEARDPLERVRVFLESQGVGDDFFAQLDRDCDVFAEQVRTDCRALPDPRLDDVFRSTYSESHSLVDEEYSRYLADEEFLANGSAQVRA
ncbi:MULTISPECIES: thiamine pyrophosphate-dependent dehydrogenase E1 component subunit alpha [Gordonia]|jgi:2-oxoisovalerate dehydrogenase E1 component alpha subunit|uniref:thiamine pyrophosphate-dependent dehydrogenase E1 component subunit alpha n=1 Tax=Gordonia TaxID=2053 RepID=UPI0021B2711E|nr:MULTISPECIES: thiamine pyrophosphate-dependent enzyme [Gordonia]